MSKYRVSFDFPDAIDEMPLPNGGAAGEPHTERGPEWRCIFRIEEVK